MRSKSIHGAYAISIQNQLSLAVSNGFIPILSINFPPIKRNRKAIVKLLNHKNKTVRCKSTRLQFIDENHREYGMPNWGCNLPMVGRFIQSGSGRAKVEYLERHNLPTFCVALNEL